jgi:NADH-quinone oxidoreductase subunit A
MAIHFSTILVFLVSALALVAVHMGLSRVLRPHRPSYEKLKSYECGEEPIGTSWVQFNSRFYLIALVFLIFDIEAVFMFPVVSVFKQYVAEQHGWLALVKIFIFLGILVVGLAYSWSRGDLDWVKPKRGSAV